MTGKKTFFPEWELDAIQTAERISSVLSIFGSFFVMVTFLSMSIFRKPINRLVFYATIGNVITNIATLISRSSVTAGVGSPLCQLQAFIIQMFMPADALWMLSMSVNVYLTFFYKYTQDELRALEFYYIAFNYGITFIPAIIYLLIEDDVRGPLFGNATLWCWVTVKWNFLRIATFYGPVWIVLISTISIYIYVGRVVFRNKYRFEKLIESASAQQASMATRPTTAQSSAENATDPMTSTKVVIHACGSLDSRTDCNNPSCIVNFEAGTRNRAQTFGTSTSNAARGLGTSISKFFKKKDKNKQSSAERAAWAYLRCSFMFFTAMMVTWVCLPPFLALSFLGTPSFYPPPPLVSHNHSTASHFDNAHRVGAELCAVVGLVAVEACCAEALFRVSPSIPHTDISQVPATVNRITTLIDPTLVSFGLNFTEALLLPLQGFFNAMIYIAISSDACQYLRSHCKRVFRQTFIDPWKRVLPKSIRLNDLPAGDSHGAAPLPGAAPQRTIMSRGGYPKAPSCGQPKMDPHAPLPRPKVAKAPKPYNKDIQPEEIEEYERLYKKLSISPDIPSQEFTATETDEYTRRPKIRNGASEPRSSAGGSSRRK
ncbi:hypothetical protein V492_01511 [Pseudogymnoascus sp. VKM F-4246]|nr:hypothetical protein V492_01511 [Pseudogymnoascus sp. VKM F-4246]